MPDLPCLDRETGAVSGGWCVIDGFCLEEGEENPENPCLLCDPEGAGDSWTEAADGTRCTTTGDDDNEGEEGTCLEGECVPHDQVLCECDEESPCCDGCNPINIGDECADGELPCVESACSDKGECLLTVLEGWCLTGEGTDQAPWQCRDPATDPANCGTCGNICPEDGICVDGDCFTPVTGVAVEPPTLSLPVGDQHTLTPVFIPAQASNQKVTWTSDDETVATVDEEGTVTALEAGEVNITVTTAEGDFSASAVITVVVPVTGVVIHDEYLRLPLNSGNSLTAEVLPPHATNQEVVWSTTDPDIISINPAGMIFGSAVGQATVTVRTEDGDFTDTVIIQVYKPVSRVTLPSGPLFLSPTETEQLVPTITPADATFQAVAWESADTGVATVDENGLVKGVGVGETIFTVRTEVGNYTDTVTVIVRTPLDSIIIHPESLSLPEGNVDYLMAIVDPEDATIGTITWESGDPDTATVDSNGVITAVKEGLATIEVLVDTVDSTHTDSITVQVYVPATGVTLSSGVLTLFPNETEQFLATVTPAEATFQTVVWESADQGVATVDENGLVKGVGAGETTVTVRTEEGDHTDTAQVTVTPAPAGFEFIPAGTFIMGSPSSELGYDEEYELQREVTITMPFLMKATQVTQGEWEELMGDNPSEFVSCGQDCPVENVNWHMALKYANALSAAQGLPQCFDCGYASCEMWPQYSSPQECPGYRLPTEAEWEYAARAGSQVAFHTGEITHTEKCPNMDLAGWYWFNASQTTHPVGSKAPNNWGLYDMHGNVWEWVWDVDGPVSSNPLTDPHGPPTGYERIMRGGSWSYYAGQCRAGHRGLAWIYYKGDELGFRVVRTM